MRLTSIATAVVLVAIGPNLAPAAPGPKPAASGNLTVKSIKLSGTTYDAATGLLTATGGTVTGNLAGLPFTTDITKFALQLIPGGGSQAGCSVLNLALGPIDLSLLGLFVDTSPICLTITAFPGQGLLGDLLCGLAGGNLRLLGSPILVDGLSSILTQALHLAQPTAAGTSVCKGACPILDLVLGPVDLTLLGLNVHLDNCSGGPVEVCVSATAGGGLLGKLLCRLASKGLLGNITLNDIAQLVNKATR